MNPGRGIKFIDFHTHNATGSDDTVAVMNLMAGDEVPADFPDNTLFSAGIHPWQLTDDNLAHLQTELLLTVAHPHVAVIGEAGFDRLKGGPPEVQYEAYIFQAKMAAEMDKPMVIHCVKGWDELRRARREIRSGRPWVIHGFRGNSILAASLADEGFWFSLGTAGLKPEIVKAVSHERVLLETDDSGEKIAEVYRLFALMAGYDGEVAEGLMRRNFNALLNYSL
jgi:TatD DNase family protein